ncbi:hypothetical protein SB768_07640 [Burkholderia sp. SIMBA_043]|uniref:hypothetical protein n=1 Tax=Burkholderia TaxID=32008 RepID=UPI000AB0659B|nr:hypothetical protein [Burkholderia vietnamiensis]UBI27477.1 hypothetical protein LA325_14940 [Burkholderia vietnamiensis]
MLRFRQSCRSVEKLNGIFVLAKARGGALRFEPMMAGPRGRQARRRAHPIDDIRFLSFGAS